MRGGPLLSGACLTSEHIQTHPWPICLRDDGPGRPNGTKERSCLNFTWSRNKINVQKEFKQATTGIIETPLQTEALPGAPLTHPTHLISIKFFSSVLTNKQSTPLTQPFGAF